MSRSEKQGISFGRDVFYRTAHAHYPSAGDFDHASLREVWNSAEMIGRREEIRFHKSGCMGWFQDSTFNAFQRQRALS